MQANWKNMEIIAGQGSNRIYLRETVDGRTIIRVKGTSYEENRAFISMARHFHKLGLPVPEVYEVSEDEMEYTQEDLGDTLLYSYIENGRTTGVFSEDEKQMLIRTLRALAHLQIEGAEGMNWSVCYPVPQFDRRSIMWDLNYFKYDFLKLTGVDFSEPALETDFERLANRLLTCICDVFMMRDCQSRNVMIKDGKPYFIDFQGGRRGPIFYDIASFLWQAKANIPQPLREELIDAYYDELHKIGYIVPSRKTFEKILSHFVLFRMLQVLGAYGFRGLYEHKKHFVESIPFALRNLRSLFEYYPELQNEYPALFSLADKMLPALSVVKEGCPDEGKDVQLTVTIYSFSFKKGVPEDASGNGGGYVFDCRSTHNPGKYEQFKQLTGRDEAVIEFLERDGEILTFLSHVRALVAHHVERFIERQFTHLQISFGCTGGQHRSVYCAEYIAKYLQNQYPVHVELIHRELGIRQVL